MNDGDAASWKEEYLERRIEEADERGDDLNFGTFQDFKKAVTASFSPYNAPGDALDEMRRLRMTSDTSMDEHVAKFKILVTRSRLTGNTTVQDFFRETLFPSLQRHILCCDNPPATLDDWYKKASQYHANYKKMQRIFGQKNEASASNTKTNNPRRKFTFPRKEKDPNTMDVDVLTTDERTRLMRRGSCFGCKKPGHLHRDCPDRRQKNQRTGASVHAQIRAMLTELPKDERQAAFFKKAEDEGMGF